MRINRNITTLVVLSVMGIGACAGPTDGSGSSLTLTSIDPAQTRVNAATPSRETASTPNTTVMTPEAAQTKNTRESTQVPDVSLQPTSRPNVAAYPTEIPRSGTDLTNVFTQGNGSINALSNYTFAVSVPHMVATDIGAEAFNSIVDATAGRAIESFLREVREFRRGQKLAQQVYDTFTLSYSIAESTSDLVSIEWFGYTRFGPGAYPMNFHWALNYDRANRRVLSISDLLKSDTPGLVVLAEYCSAQLDSRFGGSWYREGAAPESGNFENWVIRPGGLEIIFTEGQIGPHVFGQPTVVVPYDVISSYVAGGSILERRLKPAPTSTK